MELSQTIPGSTLARVGEGIAVTVASGLLFAFDSAQIMPAAGTSGRFNLRKSYRCCPSRNNDRTRSSMIAAVIDAASVAWIGASPATARRLLRIVTAA